VPCRARPDFARFLILCNLCAGQGAGSSEQIEETTSDYDREKLQERVAKLAGGVAVIKVGAATEVEMKEKKARVEDALHATRAAVEEGVVRAAASPWRALAAVEKLKYTDMIESGILDPTKVVRTALQNAVSIAGLMITTEAMAAGNPGSESTLTPFLCRTPDLGGYSSGDALQSSISLELCWNFSGATGNAHAGAPVGIGPQNRRQVVRHPARTPAHLDQHVQPVLDKRDVGRAKTGAAGIGHAGQVGGDRLRSAVGSTRVTRPVYPHM
jgi:hypothetical protein